MPLTKPISLSDKSAPVRPLCNALDGDVSATVAIVGGGYTGCSTALHLAGLGVDAVLLEAETIGYGGSGRNAGAGNSELPRPVTALRGETLRGLRAAVYDLAFTAYRLIKSI